jgi:hypothetical protein
MLLVSAFCTLPGLSFQSRSVVGNKFKVMVREYLRLTGAR